MAGKGFVYTPTAKALSLGDWIDEERSYWLTHDDVDSDLRQASGTFTYGAILRAIIVNHLGGRGPIAAKDVPGLHAVAQNTANRALIWLVAEGYLTRTR